MARKRVKQNRNARIEEHSLHGPVARSRRTRVLVATEHREDGFRASVAVRERPDVATGRSVGDIEIMSGNTCILLSGRNARTLFRVLDRAINGTKS